MLASEVSYTSLRLIVESSLDSRDLLASAQDTNSGNPACSRARCHAMFHSDKQADAITERPSERVSSDKDATGVMMQSSKMGESVGMILLFVPMNHQEVVFTITQIGNPPNPPTKMMKIVGKI